MHFYTAHPCSPKTYSLMVRGSAEYSHDPCFIPWDFLESQHFNMDILVSWPLRLLDYQGIQRLYYNQRVRWRCGQYKSAKTIDQWACGILNRLSGSQQAFSFLILALPIYSNYILVNCNFLNSISDRLFIIKIKINEWQKRELGLNQFKLILFNFPSNVFNLIQDFSFELLFLLSKNGQNPTKRAKYSWKMF